ncbi:MAG: serine protease, partial [Stigonema ocellatum SAG 48.90 = DSM 106950]|nr:serine protease [Stigonema ocellatum SAG 48.90 = DSM 106950]
TQITVRINSKTRYGSGVIIKKEGNTYTVLTANHVVDIPDTYEIVTVDDQRYALNYKQTVKQLPGVDLAVVQFTSTQNYTLAKIGNSDESTLATTAYVAGFLAPTLAIKKSVLNFSPGEITANGSQGDGYALIYDNNTQEGMSGGLVMNEKGELVGVHGRTNKDPNNVKTGLSLGIPINTFLRLSAKLGVDVGVRPPNTAIATAPKADDFYIQGFDKYELKDYKGAIAAYSQAIRLNPNYTDAYNYRGNARYGLGDNKGAIEDYNQALLINPNYDKAYNNRGIARSDLGDNKGAIEDYNQALRINPNYANAYGNRGIARSNLGDNKGAIEDLQKAADLFQQQKNTALYQKAMDYINQLRKKP